MTKTAAKSATRTAPCGCSIAGRFVKGGTDCSTQVAFRNGEITGSALTYHYNKAGLK